MKYWKTFYWSDWKLCTLSWFSIGGTLADKSYSSNNLIWVISLDQSSKQANRPAEIWTEHQLHCCIWHKILPLTEYQSHSQVSLLLQLLFVFDCTLTVYVLDETKRFHMIYKNPNTWANAAINIKCCLVTRTRGHRKLKRNGKYVNSTIPNSESTVADYYYHMSMIRVW